MVCALVPLPPSCPIYLFLHVVTPPLVYVLCMALNDFLKLGQKLLSYISLFLKISSHDF